MEKPQRPQGQNLFPRFKLCTIQLVANDSTIPSIKEDELYKWMTLSKILGSSRERGKAISRRKSVERPVDGIGKSHFPMFHGSNNSSDPIIFLGAPLCPQVEAKFLSEHLGWIPKSHSLVSQESILSLSERFR
ncbi:hypothetical protein Tco_1032082 [Tanacetum coccineum]|uniref:Ribosomal protein L10 n=1 Tax=Tanacetum coccineum TaxID=301880 RepID=A0ABQ5GAU9_9ASTR